MTEEAQMRAIAMAIGLPEIHNVVGRGWVCGWKDGFRATEAKVPNWLHDLNACHEMEKVLTPGEKMTFRRWLSDGSTMFHEHAAIVCHATAKQRCKAFLRTKGLWTDEPMQAITESFEEQFHGDKT